MTLMKSDERRFNCWRRKSARPLIAAEEI